jgi:hypothetical protein
MRRWWLKLGIGALVFTLVVVGARLIAAPTFESAPDSVRIIVTDVQLPTVRQTVIFDHQFSHQASAIYQRLAAGVQYDNSYFASCPSASNQLPYYDYQLTFFHLGVKVATATSEARGCATFTVAYLDGSVAHFSWAANDHTSFWVYLHQTVNAPDPINTFVSVRN